MGRMTSSAPTVLQYSAIFCICHSGRQLLQVMCETCWRATDWRRSSVPQISTAVFLARASDPKHSQTPWHRNLSGIGFVLQNAMQIYNLWGFNRIHISHVKSMMNSILCSGFDMRVPCMDIMAFSRIPRQRSQAFVQPVCWWVGKKQHDKMNRK